MVFVHQSMSQAAEDDKVSMGSPLPGVKVCLFACLEPISTAIVKTAFNIIQEGLLYTLSERAGVMLFGLQS